MPGRRRGGYRVEYSQDALDDLRSLPKRDQVIVRQLVPRYPEHDPASGTGARERMRPNTLAAEWSLHLGTLRVYYDIWEDTMTVWIVRVGDKPGNTLYLRGQPFDLG